MTGMEFTRGCEGLVLVAKPDAKGAWVIGIGRDIPAPEAGQSPPTCTEAEAEAWFKQDYGSATLAAERDLGEAWDGLDEVRRAALTDMAFEMGEAGLAGFHKFLLNVRAGLWFAAEQAGLDSAYAREVSVRADRVLRMIGTGVWA